MAKGKKQNRKKKDDNHVPGIIKIKLGACLTAPTRRFREDLKQVCHDVNCGVNNALNLWWAFHRENPDHHKPKPGEKLQRHNRTPPALEKAMRAEAERTSPHVAATLHCEAVRRADDWIAGKTPWDHPGVANYRWQAVIFGESGCYTKRTQRIAFRKQELSICYQGFAEGGANLHNSPGIRRQMERLGKSSCIVRLPMFSRASGRDQTAHIVRLFIKRLSAGQKRILLQIAKGELKMMGSEVVYREDKEKDRKSEYKNRKGEKVSGWYLHLTYAQPLEPLNLDARRVATLSPARYDARRPFVLTLPGGKTIGMGDGVPYIKEFERLEVRRKSLHHRYRSGGGKGRGRRRYYQNLKPNARRTPDMQAQFRRRLISFLRRMLERHNCGKLVYREPAMPLRDRMWFGQRNAPFNWSVFEADLKRFCLRHVVKYPKPNSKDNERIGYKEWVANHGEFPKKSGKQAG